MTVTVIANLKGGVGKTTLAINLACQLKATVIDADSQGSASAYGDGLPVAVIALPLDNERGAGRWVERVLHLGNVVIDCPPNIGSVTNAAMGIADIVLIPCGPSMADIRATVAAIELVRQAREARARGPACLLVPSRVDMRTAAGRELAGALKALGEPVAPVVRQRVAFVDAWSAGQRVGDYARGSDAHQDIEALAKAIGRTLDGKAKRARKRRA